MFLVGTEIDKRVRWRLGTAERLARKGKLPYRELPDGSIRFVWSEIEPLIQSIPAREVTSC